MKKALSILLFVFAMLFMSNTVEAACCEYGSGGLKTGYVTEIPSINYALWVKRLDTGVYEKVDSGTIKLHFKWHDMYACFDYPYYTNGYVVTNTRYVTDTSSTYTPPSNSSYIGQTLEFGSQGVLLYPWNKEIMFYGGYYAAWNAFEQELGLTMDNYSKVTINFLADEKYATYRALLYDTNYSNAKYIGDCSYTVNDSVALPTSTDSIQKGYYVDYWYTKNQNGGVTKKYTNIPKGTTQDLSLYSHYALQNYTITYELNGGINNANNPSSYTVESEKITFKSPSKTGYVFDGWYTNSSYTDSIDDIETGSTGNITLYAKYTPFSYKISYNNTKNMVVDNPTSYTIESNDIILNPLDNPTNYVFAGWYKDSQYKEQCDSIVAGSTGDVTLYAKWEACSHLDTSLKDSKTATCLETGYSGDTYCNICNVLIEEGHQIPVSTEHLYDNGKISKQPTETETGLMVLTCTVCLKTKEEILPVVTIACKHEKTEIKNSKDATCKTEGYSGDTHCSDCDDLLHKGSVIAVTDNHEWILASEKAATTTAEGEKKYYCSICGKEKSETIPQITENPDTKEDSSDMDNNTDKEQSKTQQAIKEAKQKKATISKLSNTKGRKLIVKTKQAKGYKYQIQVCTSKKFNKSVKTYKTSKTSYTIKKLKKGTKVYVRVRTYKIIDGKTYYGKWSKVKAIKITK